MSERYNLSHWQWGLQWKFFVDIVEGLNLHQLSHLQNMSVQRRKWVPPAFDSWLQHTTVLLHWKCPVAPDWSSK